MSSLFSFDVAGAIVSLRPKVKRGKQTRIGCTAGKPRETNIQAIAMPCLAVAYLFVEWYLTSVLISFALLYLANIELFCQLGGDKNFLEANADQ
jgi:hypothetical protein